MQITFNTDSFAGNPANLTNVLSNLKYANCYTPRPDREVEKVACSTPSAALKFCRYVNGCGITAESEKVFLKNPSLGIRYLRMVRRSTFQDDMVQKRFWRKVVKKPELALEWSRSFNKRLSEQEEEVFVNDMRCMKDYAISIIKGKFPEKVHQMILLRSFEQMASYHKKCLEDYVKFAEAR